MKLVSSLFAAVLVVGCVSHDEGPIGEATGRVNASPPQQLGMLLAQTAAEQQALEPQGTTQGGGDAQGHGKGSPGNPSHSKGGGGRGTTSPDMLFHGGEIMNSVVVQPIFWGTSWQTYNGDKMSGIDLLYAGFNGSDYAKASDEYTGSNGSILPTVSSLAHIVDTSAASSGDDTLTILAEVCKVITSPATSGNGYYPVYTDLPRNGDNYCAYHSSGNCNGVAVQFAFFWSLDGDSGCDPRDTSGLHSQGLAAIGNATAHEISEARSDPLATAWYDSALLENADKCAWTYGAPLVTLANGSQWKLQGLWSNNAYDAGTGYANSSGQRGCLSGL